MADVFISYAREDRDHIDRLAVQLEQAGLICWWDKQLAAGDRYLSRTETELDAAKAVLVVWTRHSVGSAWVTDEAGVGRENGRLVPISLDGSLPPLGFRQFQVQDFAPWITGDLAPLRELVTTISRLAPESQADPARVEVEAARPAWWPRLTRKQINVGAAACAALILFGAAFAFVRPGGRAGALAPSIAVLPFANLSGDPGKDYLARGVAVEIIDKLSQLDGVDVISRNSSFTFSADADARKVGSDLKVAHVLTGSVREENERIAITAELVDAERGTAIWSQRYQSDFTASGVDALQRQIAAKVSGAMSIAFNVDKQERPSGSGTQSLEAYDFYLRGLDAWWYTFDRDRADELFSRAIEIDPNYADAWAGLAITTASRWGSLSPEDARQNFDEAYQMARRAVDLDPNLSVAQSVFGAISTTRKEWRGAEEATVRALRISRSDMALNNRQFLLLRTGRLTAANNLMDEINQVDPLRGNSDLAVFPILSSVGRHDELNAIMSQRDPAAARALDVLARINAGEPSSSVRETLKAISRRPEEGPAKFASSVLAVFDNPAKARAVLRAWYDDPDFQDPIKWDLIPILAAWYGDTDLVLRVWQDELPISTPRTAFIWGPAFAPARATPEFKALMTQIGLVDYWRAYGWADKCRPVDEDDFECN
jgi:TolB-like protein